MSDGVVIKIDTSTFAKELKALKIELQEKAARSGLNAGAQLVKKAVVARAPVLKKATKQRVPGALKKAIYVTRSKSRSVNGSVVYTLGVRSGNKAAKSGRDAFYWRFLESGWQPRGKGAALKGGDRSKQLQRSRNLTGGAKLIKRPFIAPAFEANKKAALDKVISATEKYISRMNRGKP